MKIIKVIFYVVGAFLLSVVVGIIFDAILGVLGLPPMPVIETPLTLVVFILVLIYLSKRFK